MTAARRRYLPGPVGASGFRRLVPSDGEEHQVRTDLGGEWSDDTVWSALATITHLSDLHVRDHQSPGRVEQPAMTSYTQMRDWWTRPTDGGLIR